MNIQLNCENVYWVYVALREYQKEIALFREAYQNDGDKKKGA